MTAPVPRIDPHQLARFQAAVELIRAIDAVRELAKAGRWTGEEKRRHDAAVREWDRLNGGESR